VEGGGGGARVRGRRIGDRENGRDLGFFCFFLFLSAVGWVWFGVCCFLLWSDWLEGGSSPRIDRRGRVGSDRERALLHALHDTIYDPREGEKDMRSTRAIDPRSTSGEPGRVFVSCTARDRNNVARPDSFFLQGSAIQTTTALGPSDGSERPGHEPI
jgi:hypothetical protein